jgi:trigger factor
VSTAAIDQALQRLQDQATRYEPIEKRPIVDGDTIVLDIEQRNENGKSEAHNDVSIAIGSEKNPPGFDTNLIGLTPGDNKTFVIRFPKDSASKELANTEITYSVVVKELRSKVVPELNDEFAKQLGNFQTIDSLRERVEADLKVEAEMTSKRQTRNDLLKQLTQRIPFELPTVLVNREIDRRVEEFSRQLSDQKIDPRQANIDWAQFKNNQQESARASVSGAIILDELARRESLVVEANDVDQEIKRIASRLERTPVLVRAQLEKDGGIVNLELGLRREKAVELALAKAKIITT